MKKLTKALALLLVAALLVGGSVMGTLAYLTSQDTVTNTFTVGSVKITLDETDVDPMGNKDGETPVKANEYKLLPGHSYTKDPTIHIDPNSEVSYLFVKVENGIAAIEDSENTIAAQMVANGWTKIDDTDVYAYTAAAVSTGNDVPVFESFTIKGDVKDVSSYSDAEIVVTAYAVQADGFDTAKAAWDATFGAEKG